MDTYTKNSHHSCSKKIIERINNENIIPRSKSYFLATEGLKWIIIGMLIIITSLAWAVVVFRLMNIGEYIKNDYSITLVFPLMWLGVLIISSLCGMYVFRYTSKGYKPSLFTLFVLNGTSSLVIGTGLSIIGVGYIIDSQSERVIPLHRSFEHIYVTTLNNPNKGNLIGHFNSDTIFIDHKGNHWIAPSKKQSVKPQEFIIIQGTLSTSSKKIHSIQKIKTFHIKGKGVWE